MKNIIPGVDKALCVMETLFHGNCSQQELESLHEISSTTCYRILQTLSQHGWIFRNEQGLYEVSSSFSEQVSALQLNRMKFLQPILEKLTKATGLASKLSIREGNSQVIFLREESPRPFGISPKNGSRFPLVEGTVGAALLASAPDEEIMHLCSKLDSSLPENDASVVLQRKKTLLKNGWIFSEKITRWGVMALSVPLRFSGHVIAAVTLIGTKDDFQPLNELTEKLLTAVKEMETML